MPTFLGDEANRQQGVNPPIPPKVPLVILMPEALQALFDNMNQRNDGQPRNPHRGLAPL